MEAKEPEPTPIVEPVKKEKKPRTEAQMKAFEQARGRLKENQEARKFSREQQFKNFEDSLKQIEEKAKKMIDPQVEVKPMERRKPRSEPKPRKLEVVIPAEVEKAVEESIAPKKPSAPRTKSQPPQEYPTSSPAPAKPAYSNPYMDMLSARMRR